MKKLLLATSAFATVTLLFSNSYADEIQGNTDVVIVKGERNEAPKNA